MIRTVRHGNRARRRAPGEKLWPAGAHLRPIDETEPLDWAAVAEHLGHRGLQVDRDVPARQFAGGLANLNFLLRVDGSWMVLRRPPLGPLPPGANDMRREHCVLSRLWRALPVAPRSHYLCDDAKVAGAPFQLMEYRSGLAIRGSSLSPLPAGEDTGRALSSMLVATLAEIHAVDPAGAGLGDLGRPEGFFRRNVSGWERRATLAAPDGLSRAATEILHWLRHAPDPDPGPPVLLHNDFKLDNVLIDPGTLQPRAVVDWDMATRGDALFDLATLLSYWTEAADPPVMHELQQMPTASAGFDSREEAAGRYAAATARSLAGFKPYRVLAMLKLGVVFQQLHRLHAADQAASRRYAGFDRLGEDLLEFTLDIVHDRIF